VTSTRPAVPSDSGPADLPVAKIRGSAGLAAIVPSLLGFWPRESLVLLMTSPPRQRVCLTMRVDLPPVDRPDQWPGTVASLRPGVVQSGGTRAAVLVHSARPEYLPAALEHVRPMLAELDVDLMDALRVHDGRWYSGLCQDPRCCPPDGLPVPGDTPAVAQLVVEGAVVRASRDELRAEFTPPSDDVDERAAAALGAAADRVAAQLLVRPTLGVTAVSMARELDDAIAATTFGLPLDVAMRLAVLVGDGTLRDAVYRHIVGGPDDGTRARAHRALWAAVCRELPGLRPVVPLMLFALSAYLDGDGGSANVAVEQAQGWQPSHPTVRLFSEIIASALPPPQVRQTLAQAVALEPTPPPARRNRR
jgi:hypothetical protein